MDVPNNQVLDSLKTLSTFNIFLLSVIIAPVVEELIYRIGLKYSMLNLAIAGTFISYYLVSNYLEISIFNIDCRLMIRFTLPLVIGSLIYAVLSNSAMFATIVEEFWDKYVWVICCISIMMFAHAHIDNFGDPELTFSSKILIALPYAILGLGITIVRMKIGIIAAIVFHAINNSLGYFV